MRMDKDAERHFSMHPTLEKERLAFISLYFHGETLSWLLWNEEHFPF